MSANAMFPDNERARHRLETELVIWLTTVSPSGQPQASPVWYIIEGGEFLVYSKRSPRVRNVRANPLVALNLDGNGVGGDIVTIEGEARIDDATPPAHDNAPFIEKYRPRLDLYGWTPEGFSRDYPVPIRIRFLRGRAW